MSKYGAIPQEVIGKMLETKGGGEQKGGVRKKRRRVRRRKMVKQSPKIGKINTRTIKRRKKPQAKKRAVKK